MKHLSSFPYTLCIVCLLYTALSGPSLCRELNKTGGEADHAVILDDSDLAAGIVNAGELHLTVFNNGLMCTWGWSFQIVPELPAGWYKGYGYIPDMNIWVGAPAGPWTPKIWDPERADSVSMGATVSEAQLHAGTPQSDWGPTPGSLGSLHSGEALVKDVVSGSSLALLPLMATSTLPSSWPLDESLQPLWPGPWGIDPDTGVPSEGTFVSDQDLYFSITDGPYAHRDDLPNQGYPLDIMLNISLHAFDEPYEDFIFYTADIINNSLHDYTGLYVGVFFDGDIPEYSVEEVLNDRFDWVGLDRELDVGYVYDYRWATQEWPEEDRDAYKVHAGMQFLETPQDLGLTDWHWFEWERRPGVLIPERQEQIQYAVLSGDTLGLEPAERNAYFHPNREGRIDPHFDAVEGMAEAYPDGFDCTFLMSTGPFDLPAADTTTLRWALVMGDDLEDLLENARLTRTLSGNRLVRIHPKVEDIQVNVAPVGLDTSEVTVTVNTYDHDGIVKVRGNFRRTDGTIVDSLELFDDGLHGDGLPSDSTYGNRWKLTSSIQHYELDILSVDAHGNRTRVEGAASFWAGLGVLPPFDLEAEGQEEKIYLRWSASTDPAARGYQIYYDTDDSDPPYLGDDADQGRSPIVVSSPDESAYVLTGLENDVPYYITITAFDGSGHESGYPEAVSAVPGIYRPPGVTYRCLSRDNAIELDWKIYENDAPADLKTFYIFRSADLGLSYHEIASSRTFGFTDRDVTNGLPYIYWIAAEDSAGNRRHSPYAITGSPVPETSGFPLHVGGETDYFGATVVDIDGDGENEILVSSRDEGGYALHLFELDGSETGGWPLRFDFSSQKQLTTRAVGDIDGDGKLDIVAGSVDYDYERATEVSVYAWHHDGRTVQGWPRTIAGAYFSAVALGDLEGDGDLEIIAGVSNADLASGAVYVYHHDGSISPGWPRENEQFGFTHPTISDLDGDGNLDILFASDSLYVWDHTGAPLPGWPQPCRVSYNSPNVGDIDADGYPEVAVATLTGFIYAWERDGTLMPGWPVVFYGAFSYYTALGDVDGDDRLEFVVPPFLGSGLSILNSDGESATAEPIEVPEAQWYAFPRIANVDGWGDPEIVAEVRDRRTGAFYLYAWRLDGTPLYGWPISTFGSNYDVTLCDIDSDGTLDIVTAQGPYVMSYSYGTPYEPDQIEWMMTHHDLYQTNSYGFEPSQTDVMLASLSAVGTAKGVQLQWSLSTDSDPAGFSIFRANMIDGHYVEISGTIEEGDRSYRFLDEIGTVGSNYYYMIDVIASSGVRKRFGPVEVDWTLPTQFALYQNYPNPFNPSTDMRYQIAALSRGRNGIGNGKSLVLTTLKIYNILGQEVRTLTDKMMEPGYYTVTWDGRDEKDQDVSSGIYFYHLSINNGRWSETKSMVLLR